MLFVLGSILAGVLLYDHFVGDAKRTDRREETRPKGLTKATAKADDDSQLAVHRIKSGEGELGLPPCRLMAVELGPSVSPNKATLQIMVNKSVETEFKPVTNIESEACETNTNSIPDEYCS